MQPSLMNSSSFTISFLINHGCVQIVGLKLVAKITVLL